MLQLRDITLRRGSKILLQHASASIQDGERVGLVGANGAGKSSVFALLTGQLQEDAGDCQMPAGWRVAEVEQALPDSPLSTRDYVLAGDQQLAQAQAQLVQAEQSADGMAIARVHSRLVDIQAHSAPARAEALILGLGFTPDDLSRGVNHFSGGWRMRLQLARSLMAPSELLLLDEPTNHLDLDAMLWLEGWLSRYPGTLMIISHDREFLDRTTQVTIHIENQRLTRYRGSYSAFERQHAEQQQHQQAAYARQQQQRAHLQRFVDRFRAKASKARQAQSRLKALERMQELAPVQARATLKFAFAQAEQLPSPMVALRDGALGYTDGSQSKTVLHDVNLSLLPRQRIGILGANGQGKSTLVKTLVGQLPLLQGQLTLGKDIRIGYFAQQELDTLQLSQSPLEHMQSLARCLQLQGSEAGQTQKLRDHLGNFGFGQDMALQPVVQFSGGERARLALALIVWQDPNLLVLDEPTNHLDLDTRQALALALTEFEGSLLLVSHDRAMLRASCDEFWLVADGRLATFDGDLEDYRHYLSLRGRMGTADHEPDSSSENPEPSRTRRADQRRQQAQARQERAQQAQPLKKEMQQIETRMARAETRIQELHEILLQQQSPEQIAEFGRELKGLETRMQADESRWLVLAEQLESLP